MGTARPAAFRGEAGCLTRMEPVVQWA